MANSHLDLEAVAALLAWYDKSARTMPWRSLPGQRPDPYHVWLSEIMLQQTTVATVGPYFVKFLKRWPTIQAMAAAPLDQILAQWAGLGYYARARNLHKCAIAVVEIGGVFPDTEQGLLALPGIGPYTAAAVSAIAYDLPVVPVDGNIERVTARYFAITTAMPDAKPEMRAKAQAFVVQKRSGDVAQALMDLGATICTPRNPKCEICPMSARCVALVKGIAADLPKRAPKKARPVRLAVAFWLTRPDGAVLMERRPEKGLLGSMLGLPTTDWTESQWTEEEATGKAPAKTSWQTLPDTVGHTFTHFHLEFTVRAARTKRKPRADEIWLQPEALKDHAVPTLFRKVAGHVRGK